MITIITGPKESGKTSKARELTEGKVTFWMDDKSLDEVFCFQGIPDDIECIVIEEVKSLPITYTAFVGGKLCINKRGHAPCYIDMPDVIIVSNTP